MNNMVDNIMKPFVVLQRVNIQTIKNVKIMEIAWHHIGLVTNCENVFENPTIKLKIQLLVTCNSPTTQKAIWPHLSLTLTSNYGPGNSGQLIMSVWWWTFEIYLFWKSCYW